MSKTWGNFSEQICSMAMSGSLPILGEFELTTRCNLSCGMCYVCQKSNISKKELTAKEWIQLAEEARAEGMLFLLLTGGEVFLRKDFREIYEALVDMGFILTIYSNGTLITPEVAGWLGRIPPSQIDISVYGASPGTYARVCKDAGGYDTAIRGIDLLLEQGINVQLRTTIVKGNVNDFERLAELAEIRGLTLGVVNYISPRREGEETDPVSERLDPTELAACEFAINRYFSGKSNRIEKGRVKNTEQYTDMYQTSSRFDVQDPFQCSSGKCSFWITWDGRMLPCSLMSNPVVYPLEQGFHEAWHLLQKSCEAIPACSACIQCPDQDYCMPCPARLKNETGYFDRPSAYLCRLAQERKRIYEKELILSERG